MLYRNKKGKTNIIYYTLNLFFEVKNSFRAPHTHFEQMLYFLNSNYENINLF